MDYKLICKLVTHYMSENGYFTTDVYNNREINDDEILYRPRHNKIITPIKLPILRIGFLQNNIYVINMLIMIMKKYDHLNRSLTIADNEYEDMYYTNYNKLIVDSQVSSEMNNIDTVYNFASPNNKLNEKDIDELLRYLEVDYVDFFSADVAYDELYGLSADSWRDYIYDDEDINSKYKENHIINIYKRNHSRGLYLYSPYYNKLIDALKDL